MATKKAVKIGFEQGLTELEGIVAALEDGALPLEAAIEAYERGMKLSGELGGLLQAAEARITKLTEAGREVPFAQGKEDEA